MRRFLLAWEYGGDLGHVRRQCAIARQLRDRGHAVLLAFADLTALGGEALAGIEWAPAPRLAQPPAPDPSPVNASDILLNLGFGDVAALAGALAGWSSLLRLWQPHALVADHAPAALLAARRARLARVAVGSGFSTPPAGEPMPALRPWVPTDPGVLAERDARLVAAVRRACERQPGDAATPDKARELFEADAHLVCAWPEADPFGPREDVEYVGPQRGGELPRVAWRTAARPRILAYLKARDTRFAALIEAIAAVGGEAIVAAPGLAPAGATALSTPAMRVVAHAIDLDVLEGADLCVGHAGAGLVAAAAARGVPMALLPMQLEQFLVARRIEAAGHAAVVAPHASNVDLAEWLRAALARDDLRAGALAARPAHARTPLDLAGRIERAAGS